MGPEKFCGNGGVSDPPRHSYNSTCGKNENFNSPESIVPVVRFLVSGEQARFKSSFGRFEKIPSVANVGSYQFSTVLGKLPIELLCWVKYKVGLASSKLFETKACSNTKGDGQ